MNAPIPSACIDLGVLAYQRGLLDGSMLCLVDFPSPLLKYTYFPGLQTTLPQSFLFIYLLNLPFFPSIHPSIYPLFYVLANLDVQWELGFAKGLGVNIHAKQPYSPAHEIVVFWWDSVDKPFKDLILLSEGGYLQAECVYEREKASTAVEVRTGNTLSQACTVVSLMLRSGRVANIWLMLTSYCRAAAACCVICRSNTGLNWWD